MSVVGGVTVVNAFLILLYLFLIGRLRKKHQALVGKHGAGKAGKGRYRGFQV
jgi:hypothetical protein